MENLCGAESMPLSVTIDLTANALFGAMPIAQDRHPRTFIACFIEGFLCEGFIY